jgi:mono/diheme cytochrome c family protein
MAQQKPTPTTAPARKRQVTSRRLPGRRSVIIGFVLVCILALAVFVVRTSSRSTTIDLDRANSANTEVVARGKQLYATRCASCHSSDLKGEQGWPQRRPNGVMPASPLDESGSVWQHDDQWIFTTIKLGGQVTAPPGTTSYMPGFGGGLTDADIWAVISYIKSTWPQHIQAAQPRR